MMEALCKMEYLHANIIVTDIGLPGASGLDLSKAIKRVYSDTVILILTTDDSIPNRQEALRSGVDGYITKSEDTCLEQVLTRIDEALARMTPN